MALLKIPKHMARESKKEKPTRLKPFKAKSGAKFVLFLGDEGAILIYLKGNTVLSRQFVPDGSPENLKEFRQIFLKDPMAPLILIVDSMDQSYVQQTLPPVSSMSVGKLIRRRLERDFSGNEIKGAIMLGREASGRKDWNFLMIALEKSPQLTVWLNFMQELPNRFLGIYLVSVESEIIVQRLEKALGVPKGGTGAEWKFFISHNKVGGFRQVILRNGRLMFTRLAQPVGEATPEVIAGNIEQEMLSTIEYMKRLSFTPQSKLDIYIIASSAIKAAIDQTKFSANAFHIFTPYEIGQYLNIEGAAQPADQFGDVMLAATIGSNKKHVLTLAAPQTKRVDQYYQYVMYQRVVAAMAICGVFIYGGYIGQNIIALMSAADGFKSDISAQQRALDGLRSEIKRSNIDVEKASDLIDMYRQLQVERFSILPLMERLQPITKSPVWIKSIDWSPVSEETRRRRIIAPLPSDEDAPEEKLPGAIQGGISADLTKVALNASSTAVTMELEFPQEASDPKIFRVVSKKVLEDFKRIFPAHDIRYNNTNMPEALAETNAVEIRSTSAKKQEDVAPKSLTVQIVITGDFTDLSATPPTMPPAVPAANAANTAPKEGKTP